MQHVSTLFAVALCALLGTVSATNSFENLSSQTFSLGPIDIPAWQSGDPHDYGMYENFMPVVPRPEGDVGIVSWEFSVTDAETGATVDPKVIYLHHAVWYSHDGSFNFERDIQCSNAEQITFGCGNELSSLSLPYPYARVFSADRVFAAAVHILNKGTDDRTVLINAHMTFGPVQSNMRPVQSVFLPVNEECGDADYDLPPPVPGHFDIMSHTYSAAFSGRLVSAYGHLHAGGIQIAMTRVRGADELVLYNAWAEHNDDVLQPFPDTTSMQVIRRGDGVRIVSVYGDKEGPDYNRQGVMGIMLGFVDLGDTSEASSSSGGVYSTLTAAALVCLCVAVVCMAVFAFLYRRERQLRNFSHLEVAHAEDFDLDDDL